MIKLENVVLASPEQMEFIIEGMRNPMNSWWKSDSGTCLRSLPCHSCHENRNNCKRNIDAGFILGENDHSLMQRLSNAGTEHRKYMRMMPVYVRITAPLYWWKEFDTYKVGTVANSCSTMHKIQEKEFTMEDFSCEHLLNWNDDFTADCVIDYGHTPDGYPSGKVPIDILNSTIKMLNEARDKYINGVDRGGSLKTRKDKDIWWQMIQLLPSSYNQTRNVMLNYEVLANIYRQRHSHKLDEWREFCRWIESLPYSELIIGFKEYDTVDYAKEHPDFADQIKDAVEKMTKSVPCENKSEGDEKNV